MREIRALEIILPIIYSNTQDILTWFFLRSHNSEQNGRNRHSRYNRKMEEWPVFRPESNIDRELPANLPTRQEIIDYSHLSETDFDESRYREYIQSFLERVRLLRDQEVHLRSDFHALEPFYEKGTGTYKEHVALVEGLLGEFSSDFDNFLHQKDMFRRDTRWFLAESQVENLSLQIRDLKQAMANLYTIGTYHSVTQRTSLQADIGPGQYARGETASLYARTSLNPRETEEYLGTLLSPGDGIRHETILTANGMAALTTVLSLVKSEKFNGRYLIADNPYHELTKAFEHMLSERGIKESGFEPAETLVHRMKEDDPDVIFVEPIQNNPEMREIDVLSLASVPTKHDRRFFVLDYTLSGLNLAINDIVEKSDPHDVFLLVTSLHKMYEQGDDITPAGVIHIVGKTSTEIEPVVEKLRALRSMLGTHVAVPSLLLLQKISPDAVKEYSGAIERNVATLSHALRRIDSPLVKKIVTAPEDESGASRGLVFVIQFHQKIGPRFIGEILEKAKEHNLQVSEKAAFGYRHTTLGPMGDESVVRVGPGVENSRQIEELKQIFEEALGALARVSQGE